jgi:hypothetical protein
MKRIAIFVVLSCLFSISAFAQQDSGQTQDRQAGAGVSMHPPYLLLLRSGIWYSLLPLDPAYSGYAWTLHTRVGYDSGIRYMAAPFAGFGFDSGFRLNTFQKIIGDYAWTEWRLDLPLVAAISLFVGEFTIEAFGGIGFDLTIDGSFSYNASWLAGARICAWLTWAECAWIFPFAGGEPTVRIGGGVRIVLDPDGYFAYDYY